MKKEIELQSLEIAKNPTYATTNPGAYVARVKIKGGNHETELLLTTEASTEILQFLSPLLVKHATRAAEEIAATMQGSIDSATHTKQIEAPKADESPVDV